MTLTATLNCIDFIRWVTKTTFQRRELAFLYDTGYVPEPLTCISFSPC